MGNSSTNRLARVLCIFLPAFVGLLHLSMKWPVTSQTIALWLAFNAFWSFVSAWLMSGKDDSLRRVLFAFFLAAMFVTLNGAIVFVSWWVCKIGAALVSGKP